MDHYRTLQVTRDAESVVIDRAYRGLSMKYHPDVSQTGVREDAAGRMRDLNEAYRILRDPVRRAAYDATLPPESESGWEQFLESGLIGLFTARFSSRREA